MTDVERAAHVVLAHMGTHQKKSLMKVARGERVNKQTIQSLMSRGFIRRDEYDSITVTDEGSVALRLINQEQS